MAWSVISLIPMVGCLLEKSRPFCLTRDAQKISEQIHPDKDVLDLLNEIEIALDLAPDADHAAESQIGMRRHWLGCWSKPVYADISSSRM